ncbi:MAG: hypothetical protein F4Z87_03115 [Gammaproteobacteria bacterium]|nr:hypothetical protein [Gammaproteobacteria bacterium]
MESPLTGTSLDFNSVRSKIQVPPPGGLYLACHAPYEDAAIVSAPPEKPIQAKLKALGVKPTIQVQPGSFAIRKALRLLGIWHNARRVGFLVNVRQQQVVRSITDGIFRSMCGENWARAEKRFKERPLLRDSLKNLKNLVDKQTDFGHRLSRLGDPRESEEAIVARFAKEISWQGSSLDRDLCRFALRLASSQFKVLADPHFDTRVGQLVDNPAFFRGARLVCLLREHYCDSPPITQQPVQQK